MRRTVAYKRLWRATMATGVGRAEPPLIVIVGPTASGKTAVAIELAKKYEGEIICADSRTIYRGMDIGTAKPTPYEQKEVPHWGLDLVDPGDRFTVADFQKYANEKIADIRARGKVPFLVGGTGLYIDAVIFDYNFQPGDDSGQREMLERMTLGELHEYCIKNNIQLPENEKNKRYVLRAIEQGGVNIQRRDSPRDNTVVVGIATNTTDLKTRIAHRSEQILHHGVVEEAMLLNTKYGWESEALTGNIYRLIRLYLEEGYTVHEVEDKFTTLDWKLAKRQLTWFRRNPYIMWLERQEVARYLEAPLATQPKA